MKVYSSQICSGCRAFKEVLTRRGIELETIDITENVANLRAFLQLRDRCDAFATIRDEGRIGIPAFVHEDGRVTLDENEALSWIGQPPMDADAPCCASCK